MVMAMKNKLNLFYPFPTLRLQITFIKTDEEKFGGRLYLESMPVLGEYKKKLIWRIWQFVLINQLYAFSFKNKHHFKKCFFVLARNILFGFHKFQLIRLVKVLDFHACKCTDKTTNYTDLLMKIFGTLTY